MRLLKFDHNEELSLTNDLIEDIPPYAILSHTWGEENEEVTFDDLEHGCGKSKAGYTKIKFCGKQAQMDGLQYFWVDTCCINKANHTELAEAITSMFRWYRDAVKCYVYLSDVSAYINNNRQINQRWKLAFQNSRWFTRGWTLQELIAPRSVEFFSREGERLGCKTTLALQIHQITQIPIPALQGKSLSVFGVDERLRWAGKRDTKRQEDMAYCLLGIFGVSMSLRYGEGENAFIRLKKKIRSSTNTQPNYHPPIESLNMDLDDSPLTPTMSKNRLSDWGHVNEDGWNIDFSDTRDFLIDTFLNVVNLHPLKPMDTKQSNKFTTHDSFSGFIQKEMTLASRTNRTPRSRKLLAIVQLDKWLYYFDLLVQEFVEDQNIETEQDLMNVRSIDTSHLWRLSYLNVKHSLVSEVKLQKSHRWMNELRRNLELLVNTVRHAMELKSIDVNALRIEVREVFEPLIGLLHFSIGYLQRHYEAKDFMQNWTSEMEPKIKISFDSLSKTIRYLREVSNNRFIDRSAENQHAAEVGGHHHPINPEPMDSLEKDIFPVSVLAPLRMDNFTGREKVLSDIHAWLREDAASIARPGLRNYTIYGRRGIGKTQIALEYARRYRDHYDAIFWIQAEMKATLRQSFTDIAIALELEGADDNNTFDQNETRVLRWMRHTEKRWLLIYDNAERANLLKGHWPTGGNGSMLLTSRSYFNFFGDEVRHGATVQVFNQEERRDFLLALLGDTWKSTHLNIENMVYGIEEAAIAALLEILGGLPIAIRHAANMILDPRNKGSTVYGFMHSFKQSYETLPERQLTERDPLVHALDTIWKVSFDNLTEQATHVLSCLALLAPDSIGVDLFLPSDQRLLTKKLEFCRLPATSNKTVSTGKPLQTILSPSPKLTEALDELCNKNLIKRTGREIAIHRTVQEAVNYTEANDLADYYDATVSLLYDVFPQQSQGHPLTDSWSSCRVWIQHVVTLALKYERYTSDRPPEKNPLKGMRSTDLFVKLLGNAAWYLFEIADYEEALNLIGIGQRASQDKTSLDYGHLLNTAGATYYEQNRLQEARSALETCLSIREARLDPDDIEISNVISNLGNVETAEGNLDAAMEYLERSLSIREGLGDEALLLVALNYLQLGRVHFLWGHYTLAYQHYKNSEDALTKHVSRNKQIRSNDFFTANLQYAYGNLELAQGEFVAATKAFERTKQIYNKLNLVNSLTAAVFYKLACVEFEMKHHKKAQKYLSEALDIAEVTSSGLMDGAIARILWKKAQVILDDPTGDQLSATKLMANIESKQKEIADKLGVDLRNSDNLADREKNCDLLVAGYFR